MALIYCGHCGESAGESERFCVACGNGLRLPSSIAQATAEAPASDDGTALRHAVSLLAKGDAKAAKVVLIRLLEERPDWAIARSYLGLAHLRLTEVADARAEMERAVADSPNSFICRSRYAEFLARLGFYDKAMHQLDIALELGAPSTDSRYAAMELHQFCKDKSKGIFYRELAYPKFRLRGGWPRRRPVEPAVPNTIHANGEG